MLYYKLDKIKQQNIRKCIVLFKQPKTAIKNNKDIVLVAVWYYVNWYHYRKEQLTNISQYINGVGGTTHVVSYGQGLWETTMF